MKIHILMGQRKCDFPGQYAPEARGCMDEYGNTENPDYLIDERLSAEASGDFERVVIITLDVSSAAVMSALYPESNPIPASVQSD